MRTLRKLLRVYEAREGSGSQQGTQLVEDTVRALRHVGAHPPQSLQVTIGGDLSEGRSGLYLECNERRFSAAERGRRFSLDCILFVLETLGKSKDTTFRIEVSDVDFGGMNTHNQNDAVRHLRLMDIWQSHLYRSLSYLKRAVKKC